MARKRKIPVRKHHGVRDPLKQLEQREKKMANVTNNPPTQNDEQRTSHRFKQFKKIADDTKSGKKLKLGSIGREDKPKATNTKKSAGGTASSNKRANIKQFADETDEDFLRRVNRITSASVREAQYEAKYGVNIIRNHATGEITLQKRPKNEIDELLKQKQKERIMAKNGRKKSNIVGKSGLDAKTSKELVKQAIKETDEEHLAQQAKDAPPTEYKHDVFKFGETVHAPPTLKTLPRKASKNETVPRPGRKSNLLLKSLMDPAAAAAAAAPAQTPQAPTNIKKKRLSSTPTKQQLKGKRKDLPAATRNMLDNERSKMIDLYRQLKKKQSQTSEMK